MFCLSNKTVTNCLNLLYSCFIHVFAVRCCVLCHFHPLWRFSLYHSWTTTVAMVTMYGFHGTHFAGIFLVILGSTWSNLKKMQSWNLLIWARKKQFDKEIWFFTILFFIFLKDARSVSLKSYNHNYIKYKNELTLQKEFARK